MNYKNAKSSVLKNRFLGLVITIICLIIIVMSTLKFIYLELGDNKISSIHFFSQIKNFILYIYAKTQGASFLWVIAPLPTQKTISSLSNLYFFLWYMGFFIGASIFQSGNKLAARLKKINSQIEDELIYQSIRNGTPRTKIQLQDNIKIQRQSFWKEVNTLYVAPIVVGVVLLIIGKIVG